MIARVSRWGALLLLWLPAWAPAGPGMVPVTTAGELDLSAFRGQVVYVDFWASWCKPCRKSFPWMKSLQRRFAQRGLAVVAVNLDQDRDKARAFLDHFSPNFPIAYDPRGVVARRWDVRGMPSSYLVDRDGRIVFRHVGFRDADRPVLERKIMELLGQGGGS